MDIRLTVQGEVHNVAQECLSLRRWLVHNPSVISSAEVSFPRSTRVGAQPGLSLEEINVITQNAFNFATLVVAIATWRRQRNGHPPVTIECRHVRVRLSEGTPEENEEAIRSLNALPPEPPESPEPHEPHEPSGDGSTSDDGAGDDGTEGPDNAC
ncbi:hypothetical protein ACGF4C_24625 [Streptomyces sp. NPDC048197]|uniref:effector-associated constant component EACC1 n=1 Tax=Streptomyces sp. NPDC048197 TaxID=3365511 RepID=UPI003714AB3F